MPLDLGLRQRPDSPNWACHLPVPASLRHLYGGKRELRKGLKTASKAEAERLALAFCNETLGRFRQQLAELNPTRVENVTPELRAALAAGVRHAVLMADENMRSFPEGPAGLVAMHARRDGLDVADLSEVSAGDLLDGLDDAQLDAVARFNADHAAKVGRSLAGRRLGHVQELADMAARHLGLVVDWTNEPGRAALAACLEAYRLAVVDAQRRDSGDVVSTPPQPVKPQPAPATPQALGGPKLRDVLDAWKARAAGLKRHPKHIRDTEIALALYEQQTGNPPLDALTTEQGDDFCTWLVKESGSIKTAANKFNAVNALLNFAAGRRGLMGRNNPWKALRVEFDKRTKAKPWTANEIGTLFGSELFTGYQVPALLKAGADAAYWVPLLALYSCARVSELCQLRTADVVWLDSANGPATVPALSITDEPEDDEEGTHATKAKTEHSVRCVPVHRELIRLGFLDYSADIKKTGAAQLFPAITRREGKGAGDDLSTWFGNYRRGLGITRPRAGIHAARHTSRTALANVHATDSQAYAIGGWVGASGSGNAAYLHELAPAVLQEVLDRVSYPGLDLPRVYTAPAWKPEDRQRSNDTAATPRRTATAKKS